MKKILVLVAAIGGLAFFSNLSAANLDEANKAYQAKDYEKALSLYTAACDANDAKACSSLGYMYQSGKGVKSDLGLSKKFYQKACDAGDGSACNSTKW
ncbi:hypothetical protein BKH43_02985 [Helicobacter sp. 13S00401-1]|uniref:tetratricopeptide repeat protein n=1 Tax=Helicobacter sp. 13S00401-1 TaxID=1905758 RepID=UPI000BA6285E|nr:SEL1-like repeat protein [Helicobacter sp. 13S00401-1]PAF51186.1 hypothetical protein BKH43_02985 [Helicobacter sp. 13S00401-1]